MKDLLEQVMPDFEPMPDRMEHVRRRVKARRDRRAIAGAAAAVVAVAVGGVMVTAQSPSEVPAAAGGEVCEQALGKPYSPPDEFGGVRVGASKVTLCVFKSPEDTLDVTPPLRLRPHPLPASLNDLVGAKEWLDSDGVIERKVNVMPKVSGCPDYLSLYRLVFEYPDRDPVVIGLSVKCGAPPIPREELLDGDLLHLLDRMEQPVRVLHVDSSYSRK